MRRITAYIKPEVWSALQAQSLVLNEDVSSVVRDVITAGLKALYPDASRLAATIDRAIGRKPGGR